MVLGLGLGGEGDFLTQIFFFLMFFGFIFVYPRLMLMQVMMNLEKTVRQLEAYSNQGKVIAIKKTRNGGSKKVREAVGNFMDFFVIQPVSLDPAGIMKKIEHLTNLSERRFKYFVENVAPNLPEEEKANMNMTLAGAMSLNQIMKVVRHYVEIAKKTKNLQIAMILQMQLPMIESIAKSMLKGTEAFSNGWPVGDTIGPHVASYLIDKNKVRNIVDDETVVCKKKIKGKTVFVMRARGPGGRLGKLGLAVQELTRKNKIGKVITVDAAAKLEGEKTGSVAEGVGVAIGGIGVERGYIEQISTAKNIPLDTIVVKMSQEEAIMPMRAEILAATPRVIQLVENNIKNTKEKGAIIVIGVGNCTGIGQTKKSAQKAEPLIKKIARIQKRKEDAEKKEKKKLINRIFGM